MTVNNSTETVESQPTDQPVEEVENVEAEVLTEQVDSTEETDDMVEEKPSEESEAEESFMGKGFDPNSLKDPELQKAYKQMQSKWTKDNQKFSSTAKDLEKYKKWESDLNANPYFQQWTEDMQRIAKMQAGKELDTSNMSQEELIDYRAEQKAREITQEYTPRIETLERERATARVDKFLTDNPDAKTYAKQISEEMKASPGVSMEKAWKYVRAELGITKNDAKKEVLDELSVKGDANLEMPGKQPSTPASKKGMSVEEAAELAEQQTGHKFG